MGNTKNMAIFLMLLSSLFTTSCFNQEKEPAYEDCAKIKAECLSLFNENKEEIKDIFLREMERNPDDNEITAQRVFDAIKANRFSSRFQEYQNKLENNCPEEFNEMSIEVASFILSELIKN